MAKTLPAIQVTDAQFARLARVMPGDTAAEKIASYEAMVRGMLRGLVIDADIRDAIEARDAALEADRDAAINHEDNP